MVSQIIGQSINGVNITVELFEVSNPVVKIYVQAQQHGDEFEAYDAAGRFKNDIIANPSNYSTVSIAICQRVNPDGAAVNTRENANGRDLNRLWMLTPEPEIRAVHSFLRTWQPNMIVDCHNFPSQDSALTAINRAHNVDCYIDITSNPVIRHTMTVQQFNALLSTIQTNNPTYKFDRYINPSSSGRLRFSTTDLIDTRNFCAFRYDAIGIILEGREALTPDETVATIAERARESQYRILKELKTWAVTNKDMFTSHVCSCNKGQNYVIDNTFVDPSGESYTSQYFYNTTTDTAEPYVWIWFVKTLNPTVTVTVPLAYAVHKTNQSAVISLLENQHGLVGIDGTSGNQYNIETINILTADAWVSDPDPEDMVCPDNVTTSISSSTMTNFSNYRIYNIDQDGGHTLPLLLEPRTGYGLTRYRDILNLPVTAGQPYAILRLITKLA